MFSNFEFFSNSFGSAIYFKLNLSTKFVTSVFIKSVDLLLIKK